MIEVTKDRVRKSEKLTKEEYAEFVKWVNAQPTKVDAAIVVNVTRPTLDRILICKSGRPDSIQKVRFLLQQNEALKAGTI